MTDLTAYLVLGSIILPPIIRQARALFGRSRSHPASHASQPNFLSKARLTPFSSAFTACITLSAALLVLVSIKNLIPVQYGIDVFVPSSTVDSVRKLISTIYTAPSSESQDTSLHIGLFRGGFRPDLFLAFDAPITIPTTTLRNLIDRSGSLLRIGYHTPEKQLELPALLARLSSYEARKLYLLLGPRPLVECTFCKSTLDHFWYALPFLFRTYAWRILALGLLTVQPDDSIAVAIRQLASAFGLRCNVDPHQQMSSFSKARPYEADRSGWRSTAIMILSGLMIIEMLIMYEFGQVTAGPSRLNHWHSNIHLLRQVVFICLVPVIYLCPSPRIPNHFEQTMHHLDSTQGSISSLMHISEMIDISRSYIFDQEDLLQIARQSRLETKQRPRAEPDPRTVIHLAQNRASGSNDVAAVDLQKVSADVKEVTDFCWRNTEVINQELDQRERIASNLDQQPQREGRPKESDSSQSSMEPVLKPKSEDM